MELFGRFLTIDRTGLAQEQNIAVGLDKTSWQSTSSRKSQVPQSKRRIAGFVPDD